MAPRERIKDVVGALTPLLKAASGIEAAILGPLPRWTDGPCCPRQGHMAGYSKDKHIADLVSKSEAACKAIKDTLREQRVSNVWVTNVTKPVLGCHGPWVEPLTPNIGAYQAVLAKIMEEVAARSDEKLSGNRRSARQEGQPPAKRGHYKEDGLVWRWDGGQTSWPKNGERGSKRDDRGSRGRGPYWRARF